MRIRSRAADAGTPPDRERTTNNPLISVRACALTFGFRALASFSKQVAWERRGSSISGMRFVVGIPCPIERKDFFNDSAFCYCRTSFMIDTEYLSYAFLDSQKVHVAIW